MPADRRYFWGLGRSRPEDQETLHWFSMVERGSAQIVLGNHEINVIDNHTRAMGRKVVTLIYRRDLIVIPTD